jgi:TRAP-type C4-dicarboxylate transport system substrate-binding protein
MDRELLDSIKISGIQVNEIDHDAFAAASRAIYHEFSDAVTGGQALIDLAISLRRP